MKLRNVFVIFCLVVKLSIAFSANMLAQSGTALREKDLFEMYSVAVRYHGKPAAPKLKTTEARLFKTRIRQGAARGVVFADHYSVPVWGCGAGCVSFAVVDAITGKVYLFPFTVSQTEEAGEPLTYRRNSRAMHIMGSLNEKDSADRWYVWDGNQLNLVSEKPVRLVADSGNATP